MKILIADDEAPLLRFLSRGLSAEGFECIEESALHNLVTRIRHEAPAIIVLDRMFGDEDSVELLPAIKSLPHAPYGFVANRGGRSARAREWFKTRRG
ncbi:MAG: hypothetical protein VX729_11805 [Pseudomonadota bacterium]|nr:hypothetical protein [Pseudomonadota bacterium]